jgi:hypothetical protein
LTAGDAVQDEDEEVGDAEAIDHCHPQTAAAGATIRRKVLIQPRGKILL